MLTVQEIASSIVAREGGFVNDPDDPGGATNFGVTLQTMRRLGLDLDGDGDVGVDDLRELTRAQAVDIFVRHYYAEPGIDKLPEPLQPSVFDMYVNAGANAVRLLQRLVTPWVLSAPMTASSGRIPLLRSAPPMPARRITSLMPMALNGATITIVSPTGARPRANTHAAQWRQGRLDTPCRGIHRPALSPDRGEHRQRVAKWG